jgi:ubiquinone/menaquinone biosynthesis C-methylase UbiE
MLNTNAAGVKAYYRRRESRWGYRGLLKGVKHAGYYPEGKTAGLSLAQAQYLMEQQLGQNLGLSPGAKVLDAGCGEGYVAIHLAQDFGYQAYGIDILEESIQLAEQNKKRLSLHQSSFSLMDYSQTTFPDNFFDGIYTMETGVHSPDYRKMLQEFYRLLKPGGVLINHEYVLTDNMTPDQERTWQIMYQGSAMMGVFKDWRKSKMKSIWEQAGFEQVKVRDATKEVVPFMRRLHQLAYIPFHILQLFGREEKYLNIFSSLRLYQLRDLFQYTIIKAHKPSA